MSIRLDRRRAVVPAVVFATLVIGYGVYLSSDGRNATGPAIEDPHLDGSMTLERSDRELHQSFQKSVALLQAGKYDYAVMGFHDVLRIAPQMPEAHVNMGFALLGLEKYREARDFFDAAANLRPAQLNAYYGLAVANEGLGELQQAVAAMRTYLHLADDADPFRRKAESALWEWEAALAAGER